MIAFLRVLLIILAYCFVTVSCFAFISYFYDYLVLENIKYQLYIGIVSLVVSIILIVVLLVISKKKKEIVEEYDDEFDSITFNEEAQKDIVDLTTVVKLNEVDIPTENIELDISSPLETQDENVINDIHEVTDEIEINKFDYKDETIANIVLNDTVKQPTISVNEKLNSFRDIDLTLTRTTKNYINESMTSYIDDNGLPQFKNTGTNTFKMRNFQDYNEEDCLPKKKDYTNTIIKVMIIVLSILVIILIGVSVIYFKKMEG